MSQWRLITDDDVGGSEGLALDEALMAAFARSTEDAPPVLRLYTYRDHSALCGRYQNLQAEINVAACEGSGTAYNRRPTGGGAIVMGSGQLGVAVATHAPAAEHPKQMLLRFANGIVAGLAKVGVEAEFAGKNDLKVNGRKIAGLGLYLDGNGGLLFHSSVLADLDIAFMLDVLDTPASKLGAAAIDAVAERVTTVSRETGHPWTGATLRDIVAHGFREALDIELTESAPSDSERDRAAALVESKYETDDWRYQRSPRSDTTGSAVLKTPAGFVRVYLSMNGDTIKSALLTGDFNALPEPLAAFESRLKWSRATKDNLLQLAARTCGDDSGLGVSNEQLVDAVVEAAKQVEARTLVAPEIEGSCYFPEGDPTR